jgi:AcrR family transcriptional regulator
VGKGTKKRPAALAARPSKRPVPVSTAVHPDDPPAAAQIISASVVAMAEHGYHGTSVRDIAELAGVSSAALYHYFRSKHGLLELILLRGIEHLHARTEAALLAAPPNPADRLRAVVGVHVTRHLSAQREAFLGNTELRALEPAARSLITSKRDLQERLFDRVVQEGVEQKVFTTSHPRDASRAIITMCSAVAGWYNPNGRLTEDEIVERYKEFALNLVGYQPAPTRKKRTGAVRPSR